MDVYFISGLGADSRIFKYIDLPEGFRVRYVEWIDPLEKETLADYAGRLSEQVDMSEPFVLAGLSLGGIMAVEMAKKIPPVATILISSIPLSRQLPPYFSFARFIGITSVLPASFFKRAALVKRALSAEDDEDKRLLRQLIREGNDRFIKWAVNAVLRWKNGNLPRLLWQIHGSRDEVFPVWLTRPTHLLRGAGHMAILTHKEEVNNALREILEKSTIKSL